MYARRCSGRGIPQVCNAHIERKTSLQKQVKIIHGILISTYHVLNKPAEKLCSLHVIYHLPTYSIPKRVVICCKISYLCKHESSTPALHSSQNEALLSTAQRFRIGREVRTLQRSTNSCRFLRLTPAIAWETNCSDNVDCNTRYRQNQSVSVHGKLSRQSPSKQLPHSVCTRLVIPHLRPESSISVWHSFQCSFFLVTLRPKNNKQ
jgi:hypothetical protein